MLHALSRLAVKSSRPSCHSYWAAQLIKDAANPEMENSASLPFSPQSASSPSYKSKPNRASPQFSSEGLSFLCADSLVLEHKLNKICQEISLDFLSISSFLGEIQEHQQWLHCHVKSDQLYVQTQ